MSKEQFKNLFGVDPQKIQKRCIMMPFLFPKFKIAFGIQDWHKGQIYSVGRSKNFSFIYCRTGPLFAADAIMHLYEAVKIETCLFFGAAGGLCHQHNLEIGDTVLFKECLALEHLPTLLKSGIANAMRYQTDPHLFEKFSTETKVKPTKACVGASFASIKLQPHFLKDFKQLGVDIIDMETASVLAICQHLNIAALSLAIVTDLPGSIPLFSNVQTRFQKGLHQNFEEIGFGLRQFAEELSS